MALSNDIRDREHGKFREGVNPKETIVAVTIEQAPNTTIPVVVQNSEITKFAGENISAVKAVYMFNSLAFLSDKNTESTASVNYITRSAGVTGSGIVCVNSGEFYDSSFNFTVGEPVFLMDNGSISQAIPTTGYRVLIGYAVAVDGLNINIQEKILI